MPLLDGIHSEPIRSAATLRRDRDENVVGQSPENAHLRMPGNAACAAPRDDDRPVEGCLRLGDGRSQQGRLLHGALRGRGKIPDLGRGLDADDSAFAGREEDINFRRALAPGAIGAARARVARWDALVGRRGVPVSVMAMHSRRLTIVMRRDSSVSDTGPVQIGE